MNQKLLIVAALATVAVLGAFVAIKSSSDSESSFKNLRANSTLYKLFQDWKVANNKTYGGAEHDLRFKYFVQTYNNIQRINSVPRNFTVGLNQFSDLSKAEFTSLYLGLKSKSVSSSNTPIVKVSVSSDEVDWRKEGAVTGVKNQGQCGSCWSFSTTGSLEGLNFITNKKLISFSEQQLVDCSDDYGNKGCSGGDMGAAMQYTAQYGVETEDDYAYTAEDGDCQYDSSKVVFKNSNYNSANSDADLEAAVRLGPVSVAVQANQDVFQSYTSGILDSDECGTSLDHGVLAVGFGTDGKTGYWIVKNSWGASWGDNGYLKIARASGDGICGINQDNFYPTL